MTSSPAGLRFEADESRENRFWGNLFVSSCVPVVLDSHSRLHLIMTAVMLASVAIAPSRGKVSSRTSPGRVSSSPRGQNVRPVRALGAEVAQIADSLDDAIPSIAIAASLGAILWSSRGALKGFAALLSGEEATASHILVKDPTLAQSLLERLQDGPQDNLEDRFAREAGKYSECPSKSKGGSLGTFKPGQMVKEFNAAVFEGPVGVIQGPVKTDFGWHLILVTDRTEPEA